MESAIALLEDGLRRFPGNQKVRRAVILAYSRQSEQIAADGDPEQAAALLSKAAALDPENPTIAGQLQGLRDRIEADSLYERGVTLRDAGDTQAALAAFEESLSKDPGHAEAGAARDGIRAGLVEGMQREAIAALRETDYQSALDLWAQILEIDPANGTADRYHKHTLELMSRQAQNAVE